MEKKIDLSKVPKQFCDNIMVGSSQESFVMGMLNGESAAFYALTPQHMKRLAQYLSSQVGAYEKQFGEIDAKWEPGIRSPIQTQEFKDE